MDGWKGEDKGMDRWRDEIINGGELLVVSGGVGRWDTVFVLALGNDAPQQESRGYVISRDHDPNDMTWASHR